MCLASSVVSKKTHAIPTLNLSDFISLWKSSGAQIYLRYSEMSWFHTGEETFSLFALRHHWVLSIRKLMSFPSGKFH